MFKKILFTLKIIYDKLCICSEQIINFTTVFSTN